MQDRAGEGQCRNTELIIYSPSRRLPIGKWEKVPKADEGFFPRVEFRLFPALHYRYRLIQQRLRRRTQYIPALRRIIIRPAAHHTTSPFDDGDQRCNIINLQFRIHSDIQMACR